MKKENVVWHEDDESEVMKDPDGWTLVCIINHFKHKIHYEIKTPDEYYLPNLYNNIYDAIDALNKAKKTYII